MKDIEINTFNKKFHYWFSWVAFIFSVSLISWGIALFLARFGKHNYKNTERKEYVLNQTWQKFVFYFGIVYGYILVIKVILIFI